MTALLLYCAGDGGLQGAEPPDSGALGSSAAGATKCRFGAFVLESDPAGLNVRQTPGLSGKIIGVLPPVIAGDALDGYPVKVEVAILGARHGWFRIADAHDNTALTGNAARPVFAGIGWVHGRKLTVKSQAQQGYLQPDETAARALHLRDGSGLDNDALVHAGQLIACQGDWALVEFAQDKLSAAMTKLTVIAPAARAGLPAGHFRAWVNRLCALQETRCDGP